MTLRRQFLQAATALINLPGSRSRDQPDQSTSHSRTRDGHAGPAADALTDCFGTLDLQWHDTTVDIEVTSGASAPRHDGQPAVMLWLRLPTGDVAVSLHEEAVQELSAELEAALPADHP